MGTSNKKLSTNQARHKQQKHQKNNIADNNERTMLNMLNLKNLYWDVPDSIFEQFWPA